MERAGLQVMTMSDWAQRVWHGTVSLLVAGGRTGWVFQGWCNPIGPDATDSGVALLIPIRNKKDEGECGN